MVGPRDGVGIGVQDPDPTALYGPNRVPVVLPDNGNLSTLSLPLYYAAQLAPNQRFLLELEGDNTQVGMDMSYTVHPVSWSGDLSANVFDMRGRMQATDSGPLTVGLLNPGGGVPPWFYQVGGGIEYRQRLSKTLQLATGMYFRQTTVHSGAFTPMVAPFDARRNPLTLSPGGIDNLVSAHAVGLYSTLDDLQLPTVGTKVRFGFEQTLPLGSTFTNSTRLQASWTQFIPTQFLAFSDGPRTLIFNVQAATMLGQVPGYDAYNFGGVNSVHGWEQGGLGTGQSFFEATAEYRFPLGKPELFHTTLDLRGALYVDYGTDLGTAGGVLGQPALVRGKPGEGSGIGAGLQVRSPIGLVRLESGFNNLGGMEINLTVGDRY